MPLIGTLRDVSLPSLVQLQCIERQRAQISLVWGTCEGRLVFADGELIFASVENLRGEEAVHELLTWEDAEFRVDYEPTSTERNVNTPWVALILDGVRRLDEARAERDERLESRLRSLRGTHGLRGGVLVSGAGRVRASAAEGQATAEAALVAFVAGRLEGIGAALACGPLAEALLSGPAEKLWITKKDGSYLGCWLDTRASLPSVTGLLQPYLSPDRGAETV